MKTVKDVINYLAESYKDEEDVEDVKPKLNGKEIINEEPPEEGKEVKEYRYATSEDLLSLADVREPGENRDTNFTIEQKEEKEEEEVPEEVPAGGEAGAETVDTAVEEIPAGDEMGDVGGDMGIGAGDEMGGMGGMGMGEEDENVAKTSSEVGRAYELKKINSRLASLDLFLSTTLDPKLTKVKELVSKAIDMFNTIISNFNLYKDKIDEIIIDYYKFLTKTYSFLTDYYKTKDKEGK